MGAFLLKTIVGSEPTCWSHHLGHIPVSLRFVLPDGQLQDLHSPAVNPRLMLRQQRATPSVRHVPGFDMRGSLLLRHAPLQDCILFKIPQVSVSAYRAMMEAFCEVETQRSRWQLRLRQGKYALYPGNATTSQASSKHLQNNQCQPSITCECGPRITHGWLCTSLPHWRINGPGYGPCLSVGPRVQTNHL